ncbi:hypothetical protein ACTXQV_24120, partial [Klebsiella pneumoniae]
MVWLDCGANMTVLLLSALPPFSSGQENPGTIYQFNDGFIVGSR